MCTYIYGREPRAYISRAEYSQNQLHWFAVSVTNGECRHQRRQRCCCERRGNLIVRWEDSWSLVKWLAKYPIEHDLYTLQLFSLSFYSIWFFDCSDFPFPISPVSERSIRFLTILCSCLAANFQGSMRPLCDSLICTIQSTGLSVSIHHFLLIIFLEHFLVGEPRQVGWRRLFISVGRL